MPLPALVLSLALAGLLAGCGAPPERTAGPLPERVPAPPGPVAAVAPGPGPVSADPALADRSEAVPVAFAARAGATGPCPRGDAVRVWTAPLAPRPGEPLQILAVAADAALDGLYVTDPAGQSRPLPVSAGGGPPWSLHGQLYRTESGTYRVEALRRGQVAGCAEVAVGGGRGPGASGDWDLPAQALYAVWVERLFDAPPEATLSFDSLAPVLKDPERNFLHNYLGAGEDSSIPAEPDCADLPYYLRAYFAWKLGLPVAYRACSRGSAGSPPRCEAATVDGALAGGGAPAGTFRDLTRRLQDRVHSGSGRTALADESTDFYPIPLDRSALWPGTVYADPYGHTLVLVKWVPQRAGQGGMLLAVDAQPDNSVSRKRFWEGTFLFAETPSAGPGFKAYRPLVRGRGGWRPLSNGELRGDSGLPPYSSEQAALSPEAFYARMERLVNPAGLAPEAAYESTLAALMEQLQTRVESVDTGERHMRANPGKVVPMPQGAAIFETTGPWEDYATPSRDMRLLIAMKVLAGLPDRIRRYPELFVLAGEGPEQAAGRIEALHARSVGERALDYTRSDGSPWRVTLAELYGRQDALEVAYNPNDCVERRWGADPGSEEHATCRRQAPPDQRARMEQYRAWFRETRRPPR